ncbi:3-carboxy-cis,cis-muconate cycloisomerase [Desertibaculum subflavum]|uniref:3-carboxy-cis,cis-muconate cycloisomerase n=1 Tax=Desertibaculum subflavum TaxID=2268458 RepID=UPI000E66004C
MSETAPGLLDRLFGAPASEAIFADRARLQGMLDFEAALARAEAKVGVVPSTAVSHIVDKARAELFDAEELARGAVLAGNLAIPMVKRLTALVAAADDEAARFVHWGATSQDAIDTGLVLQLRAYLDWLQPELDRLSAHLAGLVKRHRATPMVARTWLQQALPTTFGLKAAGWLDAVDRARARTAEARPRMLALQFGGAAGTLAALGTRGLDVAAALAADLGLALPALPWHGARDRVAEMATLLGLLAGTLGKIARDVSLCMQTEVAELYEPAGEGRGGSSTMPHKRNPIAAATVLAAAVQAPQLVATCLGAMVQEHERAVGAWQAEWVALPELCRLAGGALRHTSELIAGLEVDPARMRANLDATRGLIMAEAVQMALGEKLGRLKAHDLVEAACKRAVREGRHLRDVLAEDPVVRGELDQAALARLFEPTAYLGVADALIDRVLTGR